MFDAVDMVEFGEQCGKGAGIDWSMVPDADLTGAVIDLIGCRAAFDAMEAHALAELETRGLCDREFGLGTPSWVAAQTHSSRAGCRARVRLGTRLRKLPVVDQAWSEGRISLEHARALVDAVANPRVGDQIADLEADLVQAAQQAPFEIWKRDLLVLVELLDQDGPDPTKDLDRNQLHASLVGDAHLVISGELVGEHALVVAQALNTKADELFRRYQADHDRSEDIAIPPRSTLLALALADLCRHGLATDPTTTRAPHCDVTLVIRIQAHTEPDDERDDRDERDLGSWFGIDDERPGLFSIAGDRLTTLERYEHLLYDAAVTTLLVDSLGVPLDLGRTVRFATGAQRRALAVRDGGCVFPGCDAPVSWCDAHHIDWHEHGGPTDIANLALLCRHHHGVTHRTGWSMTATPDQRFIWHTPSDRTLHSQRHLGRCSGGP